jgi:hypothetical protein
MWDGVSYTAGKEPCKLTQCSMCRRNMEWGMAPQGAPVATAKTLQITDEKVRAMAATCPDAARVLKEGFPEAFEREDGALKVKFAGNQVRAAHPTLGEIVVAEVRGIGNFEGHALYLAGSSYVTTQIVTDDRGYKVLAFFKKR